VADDTLAALAVVDRLASLQSAGTFDLPMIKLSLPSDRLVAAGWLVLHRAGKLADAEDYAATAASWCAELGLTQPSFNGSGWPRLLPAHLSSWTRRAPEYSS